MFIKDPTHRLHDVAKRLDIQLSGFCDIFAADVYYHQSCYIRFVIKNVLNTAFKTIFFCILGYQILNPKLSKRHNYSFFRVCGSTLIQNRIQLMCHLRYMITADDTEAWT